MTFQELNLAEPLLRALEAEGYASPTPIQRQAIPHVLAGRDLLACAQTGTGKTAAFALPTLQRLAAPRPQGAARGIRALILTPTRELAAQILESFNTYGRHLRLRHIAIFGGVGAHGQVRALEARPDVVVATPGRLLDLAGEGFVDLRQLEVFVLDEADRMLDMGFLPDVKRVLARLPAKRQTLFFSATMPPDIDELSRRILVNPERVAVAPVATTADRIAQSVYFVHREGKRALLEHVLRDVAIERALVFTRTKHGADKVCRMLERASIDAQAIHGNKSQNARTRALSDFKEGRTRVLVATDIAARGIDVEGVSHVINFDLPDVAESYVHRIGRTARAGASGVAVSFCDGEERKLLAGIERLIRMRIRVADAPAQMAMAPAPVAEMEAPRPAQNGPALPGERVRPPSRRGGGRYRGRRY
ncbi:MAG TPA: DEAD/DEAH box helicase [Polyangiaceae bacterium]|jgi:ATP-dependent RNA helicase RhlE